MMGRRQHKRRGEHLDSTVSHSSFIEALNRPPEKHATMSSSGPLQPVDSRHVFWCALIIMDSCTLTVSYIKEKLLSLGSLQP